MGADQIANFFPNAQHALQLAFRQHRLQWRIRITQVQDIVHGFDLLDQLHGHIRKCSRLLYHMGKCAVLGDRIVVAENPHEEFLDAEA